ncbi:hypothetical protein [Paraburkholderia sp. D1E]|uniref:hypothetical protein n=1 Tax=Paraburkholderia sp. D1E TaxID=3461398 RepID=UPI00404632E1
MNSPENLRLAQQFLEKMGAGASAEEMASLCTPDLDWNIPGDSSVLPWVGLEDSFAVSMAARR